jgi:uridine phosphorylase
MTYFLDSELIINPDGTIYHLHLRPEDIAEDIIFVGDPNRVEAVSKHFSRIDKKVSHREFITHTGEINGKRVTVISTGIGTDNIDIVLNELDALANIDFDTREEKDDHKALNIIRIGTSGALQADIPLDSTVLNTYALGLDGLMHFYDFYPTERERELLYQMQLQIRNFPIPPYLATASKTLYQRFNRPEYRKGITTTCTGFYAPQGRELRGRLAEPNLLHQLSYFEHEKFRIVNFEMETSGIYGLAKILGHEAISISAILANRMTNEFSEHPEQTVNQLIEEVLEKI